jgi:hypothetical protein
MSSPLRIVDSPKPWPILANMRIMLAVPNARSNLSSMTPRSVASLVGKNSPTARFASSRFLSAAAPPFAFNRFQFCGGIGAEGLLVLLRKLAYVLIPLLSKLFSHLSGYTELMKPALRYLGELTASPSGIGNL